MMGRVLDEQDAFDAPAERFLSQDEEHDGRPWADVLAMDDELDPKGRRGRSGTIEKVPRRWSAVLAVVVICSCVILGATVGGLALFAKGNLRSWFTAPAHEPAAGSPPRQIPAEVLRTDPQLTARTPPQPETLPRAPVPAKGNAVAAEPSTTVVPPDLAGAERLRQDAIAVRKRRQQRHSEDDYVWSQELKALVHAASLGHPPAQPNAEPRDRGARVDPPGR